MTINYIIEKHRQPRNKPVFDQAWCKPVNLRKYGLDETEARSEVCSPEWLKQIDRLIELKQKEIYSIIERGKGNGGTSAEKIREARHSLRDLYVIKSQCCLS